MALVGRKTNKTPRTHQSSRLVAFSSMKKLFFILTGREGFRAPSARRHLSTCRAGYIRRGTWEHRQHGLLPLRCLRCTSKRQRCPVSSASVVAPCLELLTRCQVYRLNIRRPPNDPEVSNPTPDAVRAFYYFRTFYDPQAL